ncbi:alpha/beta hydrolase [Ferrovibrio sp.]|uniref:alpha/beta hydrolase n=1 Tax=Ferrovibrio sp. TaxID=1917215 RepID=UPI003D0A929A
MAHRGEILLLHGAFVGGWVFERFRSFLSHRGWRTHAPDLPLHGPEQAGQQPDPELARLGLADYRAAMEAEIARLPAKPVLIGHSLGGLLAQQLAARDLCRAAILLAPVAPWGIMPRTLEEVSSALHLLWQGGSIWQKPLPPEPGIAVQFSMDKLPPALQRDSAARLVPESGRAIFESLMWWLDWHAASRVSFHRLRCPLLVLAGSDDKVTPAASCRAVASHYPGRAVFREMPGMSHFLFGEPRQEELFQVCADWLADLPAEH